MATDIISSTTAPTSTRIQPLRVWIRATPKSSSPEPRPNPELKPSISSDRAVPGAATARRLSASPRNDALRGTTPYRILQNLPAARCAVVGAQGGCQTESIFARANTGLRTFNASVQDGNNLR